MCALSKQRRDQRRLTSGVSSGCATARCDEDGEQDRVVRGGRAALRRSLSPMALGGLGACGGDVRRIAFARCAQVSLSLVTVLRHRVRAHGCKCEVHHTRIAAPALLLRTAGGGLSRIYDNDDAANDVLVVQDRDVRAISRSLPVPAACALKRDAIIALWVIVQA